MSNFFSPLVLCYFASVASVLVASLEILQIAPNFLDTNYQLSVRFAKILAENGHHVHFLVPLSKPANLQSVKNLQLGPNVHVQICHLSQSLELMEKHPADKDFIDTQPEEIQTGGWSQRHYKQSPAIAYVEGFEVIADIVRQNCWRELKKNFDIGLMDVWDFGALALFHKLKIHNVMLIHNFPIMSHMYDFMSNAKWPTESGETVDYKKQIIHNGVPELFSSTINDPKIDIPGAFIEEHNSSSHIFATVYQKADVAFQKLFEDDHLPTLEKMFENAKFLFINTIPSLDYNLGKLPKQIKFIGGIDLMHSDHGQNSEVDHFEQGKKVIVFSMSSLLEPSKMPEDKFATVVKGLGMVSEMQVIWKYDINEMKEDRQKLLGKHAPNVRLVDKYDPKMIGNKATAMVISECDIRSVMDALSAKKPLLCMPMFAEQFYVAEKLRREGAAVVLDPRADNFAPTPKDFAPKEFTPESFAEGIRDCIALPSSEDAKNPWKTDVFKFKFTPEKELEKLVLDALVGN